MVPQAANYNMQSQSLPVSVSSRLKHTSIRAPLQGLQRFHLTMQLSMSVKRVSRMVPYSRQPSAVQLATNLPGSGPVKAETLLERDSGI